MALGSALEPDADSDTERHAALRTLSPFAERDHVGDQGTSPQLRAVAPAPGPVARALAFVVEVYDLSVGHHRQPCRSRVGRSRIGDPYPPEKAIVSSRNEAVREQNRDRLVVVVDDPARAVDQEDLVPILEHLSVLEDLDRVVVSAVPARRRDDQL